MLNTATFLLVKKITAYFFKYYKGADHLTFRGVISV